METGDRGLAAYLLLCWVDLLVPRSLRGGSWQQFVIIENKWLIGAAAAVLGLKALSRGPSAVGFNIIAFILLLVVVVYVYGLLGIFYQENASDARGVLKWIDTGLGVNLDEKSYGDDCDLLTPEEPFRNLKNAVYDIFILAHLLNGAITALAVRDYYMCWMMSLLFELVELSFRHLLPNFIECWWDHLFLDIFGCNTIGIFVGMQLCKVFQLKPYDWFGLHQVGHKPFTFSFRAASDIFKVGARFPNHPMAVFHVAFLVLFVDYTLCAVFFLKWTIWVPPEHWLVIFRNVLWQILFVPVFAEFYRYFFERSPKPLGSLFWASAYLVTLEWAICFKFWDSSFSADEPVMPTHMAGLWMLGVYLAAALGVHFWWTRRIFKAD